MPEKTLNASKKIILLRLICATMAFFVVSLFVLPCSASAAVTGAVSVNYRDYITNVEVDGNNDIVSVSIPFSFFNSAYSTVSWQQLYEWSGDYGSFDVGSQPNGLQIVLSPFGDRTRLASSGAFNGRYLSLANIPADATFSFDFIVEFFGSSASSPNVTLSRYASNSVNNGVVVYNRFYQMPYNLGIMGDGFMYTAHVEGSFDSNYGGWYPIFNILVTGVSGTVETYITDFTIDLSINSYYRVLEEMGYTEQIDELRQELEQQNIKLDDILNQQEQTNDKLDKLPGQIGDEMQDVIDSEKEQSKAEGNEFVDQILDALPDPSQDVLKALGALTDSMAYTGTDAVLPIPALVLPAIEGLFPETEIWGGTEFSFADYLGFLPPTLLILVQSLFTIAIVLFCAYEVKGIVSYCLTLRESKGG